VRTARPALILRWVGALAGAAYVAYVVVRWHDLVTNNNWDTDAVAKMVVADRLRGSGPVYIPHYGEWTTLWWMLATRWVPSHHDLWAVSGYAWVLAGAAVLAWATSRVAGTWAGVTAAAAMLVVGPFALRSYLATTGAHTTSAVAAIVLAAVLVLLVRAPGWLTALAGGVFAGACAASDPLLWFGGILPFAIAAALLRRRRDFALRAGALVGVAVVTGVVTNLVMHALDFHVEGLGFSLAAVRDLPHNVVHLGREWALLGGANYALPGAYPHEPIRALIALLMFAALACTVVAAFRSRRGDDVVRVYTLYWAASAVVLCVVFVVTPNAVALGPKSLNYILALTPAAGVGVTLLARSARAQVLVAACVAFVAVVNLSSIHGGRAEVSGVVALPQHVDEIVRVLDRAGVRRGYAGFWDAQNLAWQTNMHLLVAPVRNCADTLCPNNLFTITSWYRPRGGPTFLLVDATLPLIHAPPYAKSAAQKLRFGPLTLYVFRDDIARRIRVTASS
jgi:MFS family permease